MRECHAQEEEEEVMATAATRSVQSPLLTRKRKGVAAVAVAVETENRTATRQANENTHTRTVRRLPLCAERVLLLSSGTTRLVRLHAQRA